MALDVARGMQAMEEADPPIVHRDLKPSNVFIDAGGCCTLRLPMFRPVSRLCLLTLGLQHRCSVALLIPPAMPPDLCLPGHGQQQTL